MKGSRDTEKEIERALRNSAYPAPAGFADKVIRKIARKEEQATRRDLFWLTAGIAALAICAGLAMAMSGTSFSLALLTDVAYLPLFIFTGAFMFLLHLLDRRLLGAPDAKGE